MFVRDFVVSERCASRPVIGTKGRNSFVVEEGTAYLWPPLSPPSLTTPPREGNEAVLRWRWVWDAPERREGGRGEREGEGRGGREAGRWERERTKQRTKGQPNGHGRSAGKNTLTKEYGVHFRSNHGGYSLGPQSFFEHSGLGFLPQGSGWFSKASFGGFLTPICSDPKTTHHSPSALVVVGVVVAKVRRRKHLASKTTTTTTTTTRTMNADAMAAAQAKFNSMTPEQRAAMQNQAANMDPTMMKQVCANESFGWT